MDWFEKLTGFREDPRRVRADLLVADGRLISRVNGRSCGIGTLEVVSLGELRQRVAALPPVKGRLAVSVVTGDARALHRDPANRGALFQVASQFNLLEMTGPEVTPEDGVTRYASDPTQGPACAIAAGAATIYRNYFVEVDGRPGQAADRQIDCLRDVGDALGNDSGRLWTMRNGYAMCTREGLRAIRGKLDGMDEGEVDALRARLRIGVHWNVEVTDGDCGPGQVVTQAFCSALPVEYAGGSPRDWAPFATLVLEAAYEATLLAARLNVQRGGSSRVFLTRVGGGAFGNDLAWIQKALVRALGLCRDAALDVRVVARGEPDAEHRELVGMFR